MAKRRGNPNTRIQKLMDVSAKEFKGSGLILLNGSTSQSIPRASSGSIGIDWALSGCTKDGWGFPRGRIVEVYGHESSGKTSAMLELIAQEQRDARVCAFLDAEHALDPKYANALGVDLDNLLFSQPDSAEDTLRLAECCCLNGADTCVIDSVAGMVPEAELKGEIGDVHVSPLARLMSQALRRLAGIAEESGTLLVFINQTRDKIGTFYGDPTTTPGGRALKFHASARLEFRRIAGIKVNNRQVGNRTRLKVVKNKVGVPFREAEFDILFGEGIDQVGEAVDLALKSGSLELRGSYLCRGEESLAHGRDAMKEVLSNNAELYATIRLEILEHFDKVGFS